MDIYYIVYSSTPVPTITKDDIGQLLLTSRRNNALYDITGMLVCPPNLFIQFIEGPKDNILRLFENIQKDQRHYNVTLLQEGALDKRRFPDWSMGIDYEGVTVNDLQQTFSIYDEKFLSFLDSLD